MGSASLNLVHITYLMYVSIKYGVSSIPILTRFRHFPKVFSLFIVLISLVSYLLAYIIRFDPFTNKNRNPDELQFYEELEKALEFHWGGGLFADVIKAGDIAHLCFQHFRARNQV